MRRDISNTVLQKVNSGLQTISENANPKLSLIVSRKNIYLEDESFAEKRRARRAERGSLSDCRIAICHPRYKAEDSTMWLAYVESGELKVRYADNTANIWDNVWKQFNVGTIDASRCGIAFPSQKIGSEYVTDEKPLVFYVDDGTLYCMDLSVKPLDSDIIVSSGVTDISVERASDGGGLCLFYLRSGSIYYKQCINGTWGNSNEISSSYTGISRISSFNLSDGVGVLIYTGGKIYQKKGTVSGSSISWGSWQEVATADGMGAVVEYHEGSIQAFYNHENLKYKIFSNGSYGEETDFYYKSYTHIDSDNLNKGTLYMSLITSDSEYSYIHVHRYFYMKDISGYTKSATYTLQVDNSITQINVQVKNINDSLYTSNATLFSPSSKMSLGVSYGDSEIVPMAITYIDEVTHREQVGGSDTISISARNITGAYLHDLTFDDSFDLTGTPSEIVQSVMEYFGISDYVTDSRADTDEEENPVNYTVVIEPDKTGLKALEELSNMLSDEASMGMTWKTEERYDGKLITGFDDFRNEYLPKTYYTFNGRTDVFAKDVQRCIDGSYSQVMCTGVTLDGKEISVIYPVVTWRYWNTGEHKTYHASKIEGIDEKTLKKYAKALAKQLKRTGKVTTYRTFLKPQLLIGDVARITHSVEDDEEPEIEGIITEISHSFGQDGYFTDFIIDSGGNTQENGGLIYSANTKLKGMNRKKRITDFLNDEQQSLSWASGGMSSISQDTNFVEQIRNIGYRLLDEPEEVEAEYDAENNSIKIKWKDPSDISSFEPIPCAWAGTVVVRNDNGAPLHRWDGTLIKDSTTRNAHSSTWLVDNNNIKKGNIYYYGIFPYHVYLTDTDHLIKHYRYTKVFSIRAGSDLEQPIIKSLMVMNSVNVRVKYEIMPLESGMYSTIVLAIKKDSIPTTPEDADQTVNLLESSTHVDVTGLDELSKYYFVIFVADSDGNTAFSEPKSITTGKYIGEDYSYTGTIQTFVAPKTGIYKLETWGAQGGNATDGTLTARGGYGAYATGEVILMEGDTLYICVGGQDGYNGGGNYTPPNE